MVKHKIIQKLREYDRRFEQLVTQGEITALREEISDQIIEIVTAKPQRESDSDIKFRRLLDSLGKATQDVSPLQIKLLKISKEGA